MTSKNLFIFVTDHVKTGKTKTLDLLAILLMVLLRSSQHALGVSLN